MGPRRGQRVPVRPGPDRDRLGRALRRSAPASRVQKIFYLPEAHTDFILAVIGEELGLAGICGLLALYGMIAYAGLRTAKAAKGAYAKLLATGLTSLILCQALLNVYTVLGLAPLTGVPLPFISSGSTSLIVLLAAWACCSTSRSGGSGAPAGRPPRRRRRSVTAPRIVIAAGGTAGHVVPAIAVADALRAEGAEVTFVGGERAEAELVPAAGYPLDPIRVEGISRHEPAEGRARRAQGGRRARCGARASSGAGRPTPSSAAAATSPVPSASPRSLRRIPLVLTEADSHLGLTNRLLAPRARASASPSRSPGRDGDRYLVTGRPVPPARRDARGSARAARHRRRPTLRARLRRLARRPLDQPAPRWRPSPTRRTACCTSPAARDFARPRPRPARATSCATT